MNTKVGLIAPFSFLRKNYRFSDYEPLHQLMVKNYSNHPLRRPNVSLLTLAQYLNGDYEIEYQDEQYQEIDFEKKYDIVAISIMTVNAYRGYEIADEFRKRGSHVIIGGIHATLCPREVKEHSDTVVAGEGEEAWQQFLLDFKQGHPKAFYQGGEMNLDESPMPRYDLVPDEWFNSSLFKKPVYTFQYSRGCPHRCSFCSSSKAYGPKYRTKSPDRYLKEIEYAARRSNGNCITFFADDDLTIKKKPTTELLNRMADYRIEWIGCADIAIANDDALLKSIQKSGCRGVIMGLESLDATNLQNIDPFKANYFKNYDDSIHKIMDAGIPIFGSFIVGFDEDNPETFERIYNFIDKHHIPMASVSILAPLPGTSVLEQMKNQKRLLYDNFWDKCSGTYPLFKPKNMKPEDLAKGTYWIMNRLNNSQQDRAARM